MDSVPPRSPRTWPLIVLSICANVATVPIFFFDLLQVSPHIQRCPPPGESLWPVGAVFLFGVAFWAVGLALAVVAVGKSMTVPPLLTLVLSIITACWGLGGFSVLFGIECFGG